LSRTQIIFESEYSGGGIDVWANGFLGVDFVDYSSELQELCVVVDINNDSEYKETLSIIINLLEKNPT
jgi:hypothetical protein